MTAVVEADDLLSPEELKSLTGYRQAARATDWLHRHNWVYVAPERRGEWPRVLRAYRDAKLSGRSIDTPRPRMNFEHFGIKAP